MRLPISILHCMYGGMRSAFRIYCVIILASQRSAGITLYANEFFSPVYVTRFAINWPMMYASLVGVVIRSALQCNRIEVGVGENWKIMLTFTWIKYFIEGLVVNWNDVFSSLPVLCWAQNITAKHRLYAHKPQKTQNTRRNMRRVMHKYIHNANNCICNPIINT